VADGTSEPGPQTLQERARATIEAVVGLPVPDWVEALTRALSAFRAEMVGWYRRNIRSTLVALDGSPGTCATCTAPVTWFAVGAAGTTRNVAVDRDGRIHVEGPVRGRLSPCPRRRS
jgi:hypothetical protein